MTPYSWIPVLGVVLMTTATIGLGLWATRRARTADDFFVAGRSVSVFWNASAISGEYLSAASFMGIAGLVMKNGYDALWYPACYAAGYLFLLLFIAGPLRRFGAYTIPDFAEGRFDSPGFRKVAVTFVLFIGFFYTMPQMKAAGVTMNAILDWPYWAGIAVVGVVITFNVAFGGMKGITFVQAFQYWAKMFAISAPIFVIANVFGHYPSNLESIGDSPSAVPAMSGETEGQAPGYVRVKMKGVKDAPANVLQFPGGCILRFPNGAVLAKVTPTRVSLPGEDPVGDLIEVEEPGEDRAPVKRRFAAGSGPIRLAPGADLRFLGYNVRRGGKNVVIGSERPRVTARIELQDAAEIDVPSIEPAPNTPPSRPMARPVRPDDLEARPPAALYVLPHHRPDLRHGRAAPHPGPVLHQPRRPSGEADDPVGHGDARRLLRLPADLGHPRPPGRAVPLHDRPDRPRGHHPAPQARRSLWSAKSSARSPAPGPSPPSCRPSPASS